MKARIKKFEDIPIESKCCPMSIKEIIRMCGMEIDITPITEEIITRCPCCSAVRKGKAFTFAYMNNNYLVFPSEIDIDEAANPYNFRERKHKTSIDKE